MNRKIKVLHILCTGTYSGAENVAITLINSISSTSDIFECIYLSLDGKIRDSVEGNNISFYPVKKISVFEIRKALKDIVPDLIHAHDFRAGIVASLSTTKIPIINHLHNNPPWMKSCGLYSVAYVLSSLRYQKILAVSNAVVDEYIFGNTLKKKCLVIGNPISISQIQNKARIDAKSEVSDVIFLGRLSNQKNPVLFIQIIKDIVKIKPDIKAFMIGSGELFDEIKMLIDQYQLCDNIELKGFLNNPYILLNKTKVLCMPSLWEGFGLAAVEALALGIPVIATPVGGLRDFIDDDCGKLCDNCDEFVSEIVHLLTDEQYRKNKSCGALGKAKSMDNLSMYTSIILGVYQEALGIDSL